MQITRNGKATGTGRATGSQATSTSDSGCGPRPGFARQRNQRALHARRTDGVAQAPERADDLRGLGHGRVGHRGGDIEVIRPGDRVFFEPAEDHWHGARPTRLLPISRWSKVDDQGNNATWDRIVTGR